MMTTTRSGSSQAGSALLLTMVVIIIVVALSAALLTDTLARGTWATSTIRNEEAATIAEAGLSKARIALTRYKENSTWDWDNLLTYCNGMSTDTHAIRQDFEAAQTSTWFMGYRGQMDSSGVHTAARIEAPVAPSQTAWSSSDVNYSTAFSVQNAAVANFNFFGFNQPYMNGAYHVVVTDNDDGDSDLTADTDDKVLLTVTATLPDGYQAQIEALVEYPTATSSFTGLAAVVSNADVDVLGSIEVDGRDYDTNDNLTGDNGVDGIVTSQDVNRSGNGKIGGNGIAPAKSEAGVVQENYTGTLPQTPDEVVGTAEGKLKAVAQAAGTYFATEAAYNAYITANGGELPGGKIYYLEFSFQNPTTFASNTNAPMNVKPSIFVVHNSTSTATVKNVHGNFKGLFIVDVVDKVNAGTLLLGSTYCLSTSAANHWGNGNADVHYSSEVLANLPSATSSGGLNLLSYRNLK